MNMKNIRNFCIIAHIDHGKSTLADRLIEMTGTVEKRKMKEQLLDQMDLERERGITIKLQPVQMRYKPTTNDQQPTIETDAKNGALVGGQGASNSEYILNLIDTPGHVDFAYEVSRSLAAVEGAILLVDATQGVQAQTLTNLYFAIEQNLEIIPVVNKIDLPNADVDKTKKEILHIVGCKEEDILSVSGKTGEGVSKLLSAIIKRVPSPKGNQNAPLRALIFDSIYDEYKGVMAFVRIVDGHVSQEEKIYLLATRNDGHVVECGHFSPAYRKTTSLSTGDIGYIATGFKSVAECHVGDTITTTNNQRQTINNTKPLPGYKEVKPMVYASFYPVEGNDYNDMRDALDKLTLNDAAFLFEPESNRALGRGFRCGFLGLLHLEIIQQRLQREFDISPTITTPSVLYKVRIRNTGKVIDLFSPIDLPDPSQIEAMEEPYVRLEIVLPSLYLGSVMELMKRTRAQYSATEYLDQERVLLTFEAPLMDVIVNLHDQLKSASSGFASMSYNTIGFRKSDLVRMDILVAGEAVDSFARIVPRDHAYAEGKAMIEALKDVIPRQNFVIALQAVIGGKVLARETIRPFRKDVTAKLYGGDVTRKRKLLEKQKKGKKKMQHVGSVEIPPEAFLRVLRK